MIKTTPEQNKALALEAFVTACSPSSAAPCLNSGQVSARIYAHLGATRRRSDPVDTESSSTCSGPRARSTKAGL